MAVDHDGNIQALTEVVEDDGGRSGVGAAVAGTHGAGLVQQKTDRQLRDLVGQVVFVEDFSVIPMQSVGVQPPSHQQTGLLTAPPTVLELLKQALLELAGDGQQRRRNGLVLLDQGLVHRLDPVHPNADALVDVAIGQALSHVVELLQPLAFQLLAGGLFSHLIQDPGNVCRGGIAVLRGVVVVEFRGAAGGL